MRTGKLIDKMKLKALFATYANAHKMNINL